MFGRCPVRRLLASESSLSNVVGQPSSPILLDMFFLGAGERCVLELGWVHFLHQSFGIQISVSVSDFLSEVGSEKLTEKKKTKM